MTITATDWFGRLLLGIILAGFTTSLSLIGFIGSRVIDVDNKLGRMDERMIFMDSRIVDIKSTFDHVGKRIDYNMLAYRSQDARLIILEREILQRISPEIWEMIIDNRKRDHERLLDADPRAQ